MRINPVRDWVLASMRRRLCSFLAVPNRYGFAGPLLATVALLTLFGGFLSSGSARADCIEDLVSQISEARLRDHVEALEFPRADSVSQALASAYIAGELASYGYTVTFDPVQTSENILARFDGGGPADSLVVLGAHFDTVPGSPGADDNTSGVAGMLEIARVLAAIQTEIPIEFVGFALEEIGLLGSRQYAQQAYQAGVNIVGMICLDPIGYTCTEPGCQVPFYDIPGCLDVEPEGVNVGTFVGVVANDASAELMHRYADAAATYVPDLLVGTGQVAGNGHCFPDTRRSDHAPFWDHGYRALHATDTAEYRNPHYHQPSDTSGTLDFVFMERVTQATLAAAVLEAICVDPGGIDDGLFAERLAGAFLGSSPNPVSTQATLRFVLPFSCDASLNVYDLNGRLVRTLIQGSVEAGAHAIDWNLTDTRGNRLPAGVYLYQLRGKGVNMACKILLLE